MPSLDRGGTPYEITLELHRDGEPFGAVGQRCGYLLAGLAAAVTGARCDGSAQAADWPDPDDRFPEPPLSGAVRAHTAACTHTSREEMAWQLPHEPELFAFRYRDRDDIVSTGELRCALRTSSVWLAAQESAENPPGPPRGRWRVARRAVIEAWGAGGRGIRAVLTSGELARFLGELLAEAERLAGPSPAVTGQTGHVNGRDLIDRQHLGRSGR